MDTNISPAIAVRESRFSEYSVMLSGKEWTGQGRDLFLALTKALGFKTSPWPETYSQVLPWAEKEHRRPQERNGFCLSFFTQGNPAVWAHIAPVPEDPNPDKAVKFWFTHREDEKLILSFTLKPGVFGHVPKAGRLVGNFIGKTMSELIVTD